MATREPSGSSLPRRRGPRYRTSGETSPLDSESVRELRQHTAGLSGRLLLASLESMRAGFTLSPQGAARRYLIAGRAAGLPKQWAVRFSVWLERQIECVWPQEQTSTRVLAEREMAREHADDCAEKRLDLEYTAETIQARIDSLTSEMAAEKVLLGRLQRELEDCR